MSTPLVSPESQSTPRTSKGMRPPAAGLEKAFNTFAEGLLLFGAGLLGLLVIPICLDVVLRGVFGKPIPGMMELQTLALVLIAFSCMVFPSVIRSPIQIDIVYDLLKEKTQARLDFFSNLLGTCVCVLLAYAILERDWPTVTMVLKLPEKYVFYWTGIVFAFLAIAMFFQLMHSIRELATRKDLVGMAIMVFLALALLSLPFLYRYSGMQLSSFQIGVIGFGVLMLLLFSRFPIGLCMALVGILGLVALLRLPRSALGGMPAFSDISHYTAILDTALKAASSVPFTQIHNFIFLAIPMFMLMGEIAFRSGLARDMFDCADKWMGRLPGGLAVASIGGSAGFSSICGDSMTCVATMTSVALPQMRERNYDMTLATGVLAGGGVLGILIPPSIGFIFYSIITDESVGKLFLAGLLPGILLTVIFMGIVILQCVRNPSLAPLGEKYSLKEKLASTVGLLPIAGLFILVIGGIMTGWFTPGEGGAIGAMGAFLYAVVRRRLTVEGFFTALRSTALMTGKLFIIFAGVFIFGQLLTMSRLPNMLAEIVLGLEVHRYVVLFAVVIFYIVLGTVMNIIPLMLITLPTIYPTIMALGFDGIWFGVVVVLLMEMGVITPPMGLNVFTLCSMVPDVRMSTVFWGVLPFFFGLLLCTIIIIIFPQIALFLPNLLM